MNSNKTKKIVIPNASYNDNGLVLIWEILRKINTINKLKLNVFFCFFF